ncbi:hypothetical protein AVEN_102191-1 [Araneus ventricosus]|uniref:Uncharacterized protein n=1 Tax=Araneus ventricosus TaxID=182803 RepID=A0A4Y2QJM1_ARAVE|nr:hypothetical protein AVEN_102191-1 [Araneus ventricosus]
MNGNDNSNANEHSRIEKRRSFARKVLSSVEIAFDDPSEEKNASRGHIFWKGFKCIVFLTCLAYLIGQSAEFYRHYYTYPTNINIRVEETPKIKLPAATFCYRNRISAAAFCESFPDLCERPNNVAEYCQKYPQFCPKNTSSFVIPKHGHYTNYSREVSQVSQQLLFNRSDDVPFTMVNPKRYGFLESLSKIEQ